VSERSLRHRLARRRWRRGLPHHAYVAYGASLAFGGSSFKYFVEADHLDDVEAIVRNHDLVAAAADSGGASLFGLSVAPDRGPTLGVARPDLARLLGGLKELATEVPVVVTANLSNGETRADLAYRLLADVPAADLIRLSAHVNYRERLTDRRLRDEFACTVEAWDIDADGRLHAPVPNGRTSTIAPGERRTGRLYLHGRMIPTYERLAEPSLEQVQFPVDVVYLWVDGRDPRWRDRKAARLAELGTTPESDAIADERFEAGEELRYSLRSLTRYAPWVRCVHVVTDGQRPAWLQEVPGRLRVVDHREILAADALPTFNSHAITAAVHRTPGLSEHFLVMNDDVLLGRPVTPENFFHSNGVARFFESTAPLPAPLDVDGTEALVAARSHSAEVVERLTGRRPTHGFRHTPMPMLRSLLEELAGMPEWSRTERTPFRSASDIVPEWLHHYIGYDRQRSAPAAIDYGYFDIGSDVAMRRLRAALRKNRPAVFCVNDVSGGGRQRHDTLEQILALTLPIPSPFERSGPV
jgi:hypothetical protein